MVDARTGKKLVDMVPYTECYNQDNKWNIVNDNNYPEAYKPVLVSLGNGMQTVCALDGNKDDWVLYDQHVIKDKVIAWKELGKSYKSE